MRKRDMIPPLALFSGAVGALIRYRELDTIFDPATGLAEEGAPISLILVCLSLAAAATGLILGIVFGMRFSEPGKFRRTFYIRSYGTFALMSVIGIAVIVCAGLCAAMAEPPLGLQGAARWIFVGTMALAGVGMVSMAYSAYTQKENIFLPLGSVLPSVFFCYWMVAVYRINAGNPVLQDYCWQVLALALTAVSFYYSAGYAYGRRALSAAVFTSVVSIYLLTLSLADPAPLILRAAQALTAIFQAMLLHHLLAAMRPAEKRRRRKKPRTA